MGRIVRAGLTQTKNAFEGMPSCVDDLEDCASRLDEIRDANLAHHAVLLGEAAAQGVQIIGLGELCVGPYFALGKQPFWKGLAESVTDGPSVRFFQDLAVQHNMVIVAPLYELCGESYFNTAVFIDADGRILGHYRKTHIPQGRNESGGFDEGFYYGPSDGAVQEHSVSKNPFFPVFQTRVGRVGAAICFDRHFEGVMSSLAHGGAELVFSPAVTFGSKSRRMWDLEFETDAMRHQLFIGGSNRLGAEEPWGIEFFGQSYFVGPNGRCPNLSPHDELVVSDLELDELTQPDPAGWELLSNRRGEIYGAGD